MDIFIYISGIFKAIDAKGFVIFKRSVGLSRVTRETRREIHLDERKYFNVYNMSLCYMVEKFQYVWFLDSYASNNMTCDKEVLSF
jgi:hypothetical protein